MFEIILDRSSALAHDGFRRDQTEAVEVLFLNAAGALTHGLANVGRAAKDVTLGRMEHNNKQVRF